MTFKYDFTPSLDANLKISDSFLDKTINFVYNKSMS